MNDEWKDEEEKFSYSPFSWLGSIRPETPEEQKAREVREAQKRAANELAVEHITGLPPFTETPECPKCGCRKIRWSYGHYLEVPKCHDAMFERVGCHPYLRLTCRRCGYGDAAYGAHRPVWVMSPKG